MFEEELRKRVEAHYASSGDALLLSKLGTMLGRQGLWPQEGEHRTLLEIVKKAEPKLKIVRDPEASAFAIVVAEGYEGIADEAISKRHNIVFINSLPRALVLAFVVDSEEEGCVFLKIDRKVRYYVGPSPQDDGWVIVEDHYRLPGLRVEPIQALTPKESDQLARNIRAWAQGHEIPVAALQRMRRQPADLPSEPPAVGAPSIPIRSASYPSRDSKTALDRLIAAQRPDVAEAMVIPADIAAMLSRIS